MSVQRSLARNEFLPGKKYLYLAACMILYLFTSACCLVHVDTMNNQPLDPAAKKTRASEKIALKDLKDEVFIGIALSGGGSRAANFSSAVLLELDRLGILGKTTAISAVSGSALPAAYYGLYREDPTRWNSEEVRSQMQKNFELRWFGNWFLPQNILLYWTTNFNRSDMMKEVLDSNLFHGSTFADMGTGTPRILINSTSITDGKRFVFSEERFKGLNSRIDTFPVANAVMASSSFPGVFHDMTLRDYSISDKQHYEHVLDGGPSDNLGTEALLAMLQGLYDTGQRPKGCLLFVVDAYPYPRSPENIHLVDTRRFFDFIFDSNVATASDTLLSARRLDLLGQINIVADKKDINPLHLDSTAAYEGVTLESGDDAACAVWHLSLQRLLSKDFAGSATKHDAKLKRDIDQIAGVVNSIPTRYKLVGFDPNGNVDLAAGTVQDYLFKAAEYLIHLDEDNDQKRILDQICAWLKRKNMTGMQCGGPVD